jgi:hypothetical protein
MQCEANLTVRIAQTAQPFPIPIALIITLSEQTNRSISRGDGFFGAYENKIEFIREK